ncbi:MAG TPA: succinate dehydrogenase, partial [Dehalococcoidia bacterium]|nr:succinate dehydrogenase [Dehalococcoidia bacterium]
MLNPSVAARRPLTGILALWDSTIGKKFVMAITGIILFVYVILHLWGNLKIYGGASTVNGWAHFLRVFGDPVFSYSVVLWIVRVILIVSLVLHITAAYQLTRRDWASRPVGYEKWTAQESTYASRTMRWGGIFILLFIIY